MKRRVEHYTQAEARDFFERLQAYSEEYVRVALPRVAASWPSRNFYEEWQHGHPVGHILHYTAGVSYHGTLSWFVLHRNAATQWVVAKALNPRFATLRKDLDLQNDLRADCCQVVRPDHAAWHAGWVNRFLAGTEIRNTGVLRPHPKGKRPSTDFSFDDFWKFDTEDVDDLDFYWWPEQWTTKFKGEVLRIKTPRGVSWWESFSRGSVATAITLLRYLNALHPGKLQPEWILCHHNVNARKNDIVLPLDLHGIRDAVLYSRDHVDDIDWLAELDDENEWGIEEEDDPWLCRAMADRQGDRQEQDLEAFDPFLIQGTIDNPSEVAEFLRRFGFFVEGDDAIKKSVRIYQRGRDLAVDGVAGPQTMRAMNHDLRKWRIH